MPSPQLALTIGLAMLSLFLTTAFHYEALAFLDRRVRRRRRSNRLSVPVLLSALVAAHLIEIGFYALIFALASGPLDLGGFDGLGGANALNLYYFAAETYSSLGYGDIAPTGPMRLIASMEPLNGLLLLAWSGAFLFSAVHSNQDRTS